MAFAPLMLPLCFVAKPMKSIAAYFAAIVAAALLSSGLGAAFAGVVAMVSRPFVESLFPLLAPSEVGSYAMAMGMIVGLFLGAGAGTVAVGLHVAREIAMHRAKLASGGSSEQP